jgi:uncharacterized protein (TIGR03067 family)
MSRLLLFMALISFGLIALHPVSMAGDDASKALQGVWIGQSMEAEGKALPAEIAMKMQFKFEGNKFFMKGNFEDGREVECAYKLDPKKSPKHFEFTPPDAKKTILGIYEIKGDELKVCLRHESSSDGRPTAFATQEGSKLVLIVLKKKKS